MFDLLTIESSLRFNCLVNNKLKTLLSMSLQTVWNNCLEFIKDNIQEQAYKTWFEPIQPVKLDDNVLSIQVPSKFFCRNI